MLRVDRRRTAAEMVVFLHETVLTPMLVAVGPHGGWFDGARVDLLAAEPTVEDLMQRPTSRDYVRLLDRMWRNYSWPLTHPWRSRDASNLQRVRALAKVALRKRGSGLTAILREQALWYATQVAWGFELEPLDRLRFKLVADGLTWADADHVVQAAVAPGPTSAPAGADLVG
jgi:hypothetical protein